jgi:chemotaxis methyl-accepting protein methylase
LRHVCFEGKQATLPRREAAPKTCRLCGPSRAPLATAQRRDRFIDWVIGRAGLDAGLYRGEPLLRRLPACLRTLKVRSVEDARKLLEDRPELLPAAVSALLIGVTEFFRDRAVFEKLRAEVLPPLAAKDGPLRIWSAACASGEELYSLAILLAEAGLLGRSFLLGTDCRIEAVERARSALYDAAAVRLLEPAIRQRYFEPAGKSWQPVESLRRQTCWKVADLAEQIEEGPWDIILWRNLAIYLTAKPAATIWRRLAGALSAHGILIAGKAEWPPAGLGLLSLCRCVYRAAGATAGLPSSGGTPGAVAVLDKPAVAPYAKMSGE